MRKILWMSRHKPLPCQVFEICRLFGDFHIAQDSKPFSSAEDIAERYRQGEYDDIVVVAPLSVLARLVDLGIHPLRAEMDQVFSREEADVEAAGRFYRFNRFRRIKAVRLEFEEL